MSALPEVAKPAPPGGEPRRRPESLVAATRGSDRRGRRLAWVLGLALGLALLALAHEARRSARLEAQVSTLGEALVRSEAQVAAHEAHLTSIRGSVSDLRARLEELELLVNRDPTGDPPESPAHP